MSGSSEIPKGEKIVMKRWIKATKYSIYNGYETHGNYQGMSLVTTWHMTHMYRDIYCSKNSCLFGLLNNFIFYNKQLLKLRLWCVIYFVVNICFVCVFFCTGWFHCAVASWLHFGPAILQTDGAYFENVLKVSLSGSRMIPKGQNAE